MCSASLPPPLLPSPLSPSTIPYLQNLHPRPVFVASVCARASYLSLTTTTLLQIAPPRSPFPSPPFPSFFRVATSYVCPLPSLSLYLSLFVLLFPSSSAFSPCHFFSFFRPLCEPSSRTCRCYSARISRRRAFTIAFKPLRIPVLIDARSLPPTVSLSCPLCTFPSSPSLPAATLLGGAIPTLVRRFLPLTVAHFSFSPHPPNNIQRVVQVTRTSRLLIRFSAFSLPA